MKPTQYRGASAVYYFGKNGAVLMDSAEGSYGQLWDQFGSKSMVDHVMKMTRVLFITHIHGDHQLGILKIMQERDLVLDQLPESERTPIFVVVPTPMMEWVQTFQAQLKHTSMTVLIPSTLLNPEQVYYYQHFDFENVYKGVVADTSKPLVWKCKKRPAPETVKIIENFNPSDLNVQ
jgi:ribonuclease BN (tRNA processing enzyme)